MNGLKCSCNGCDGENIMAMTVFFVVKIGDYSFLFSKFVLYFVDVINENGFV